MSQSKTCKICNEKFIIDDEDLSFYKKVSPTIGGKVCEMPPPTLCPECRMIRKMVWGNERKFYHRKCALCQKEIVSVFSPDKKLNVLCRECYWSDKWEPTEQGIDFDFEKPFFTQFEDLIKRTKLLTLFATNVENSDYVNQEYNDHNCYLCSGGNDNDNCYYCASTMYSRKCIDCFGALLSERIYNCTLAMNDYDCQYLFNCNLCNNCHFCFDCTGCDHCFGSVNLRYQKFQFFNEQLSKEEYFKRIEEYMSSYEGIKKAIEKFNKHKLEFIYHSANLMFSKDCTGDTLVKCKNVKDSYYSFSCEDSRYIFIIDSMNDTMDAISLGKGELCYEVGSGMRVYFTSFVSSCDKIRNSLYCYQCSNSNDLFGCVGMNHKQYCILNKQYTKEEYDELVPKIIEQMKKTGEWGEFFPAGISPFGYDETIAMEFYPTTEAKVKKIGAKWQGDSENQYSGPFYEPKNISEYNPKLDPNAEAEINKCVAGILKCEITGKPFKILPQELAQYIERGIQLPRRHPDQRHVERLALINKMVLYHRQCMCEQNDHGHTGRCKEEFETTFEPKRPVKVYCNTCYYKSLK